MNRKIALDMDGVLCDSWSCFIERYNKKYGTGFTLKDFNSIRKWEIFGRPIDELEKDVDEFYETNGCFDIPPFDGAIDGIRELSKHGDIYIVTARPNNYGEDTLKWIDKYIPGFVKDIYFAKCAYKKDLTTHREHKSKICVSNGFKLIVEDDLDNALYCAKAGIMAFLLNGHVGVFEKQDNLIVVKDWGEVVEKAEDLFSV